MPETRPRRTRIAAEHDRRSLLSAATMLALVIAALLTFQLLFRSGDDGDCWAGPVNAIADPLDRTRQLGHCLSDHSSLLGKAALWPTLRRLDRFPQMPARYLGLWRTRRDDTVDYLITLKADGHFDAVELRDGAQVRDTASTGRWSAADGRMDWFYPNVKDWPPDSNVIRDDTGDAFTLIEQDGSRTHYTRLTAPPPEAMPPVRESMTAR